VSDRTPGILAFRPLCPRCGYDLSGTCDSWKDACPLSGVCTECGLELAWSDVLDPVRSVPPWFFEHARGAVLVPIIRTILAACHPSRFWTSVRLYYAVRFLRLAVIATLLLLPVYAILVAQLAVCLSAWGAWSPPARIPIALPPWVTAAAAFAWPFSIPWPMKDLVLASSPWFQISMLAWVAMPVAFAAMPVTLSRCRVRPAHLVRIAAYSLIGLFPICLASAVASWVVAGTGWFSGWLFGTVTPTQALLTHFGVFPLLCAAWLARSWWFACTRYLKLPHPGAVVGVMLLVSFLFGLVAVAVTSRDFGMNPVVQFFLA
jgi:hypothetical protein